MVQPLRLGTPAILLAAVLAAAGVTAGTLALLGNELSYPVMIVSLAALLVGVIIKETASNGDPLTPAGIAAATGLLLFVLRPLTVAHSQETSPGAVADTRFFTPSLQLAASQALIEVLIFFMSFYLVYYFSSWREKKRVDSGLSGQTFASSPPVPGAERHFSARATNALVVGASLIGLGLLAYLVMSSGGPAAYIAGLANRSNFLSGRAFIGLAYIPVQVALILNILQRRRVGLNTWNWITLAGFATLIVCAGSTGGRGPLIVGVFLPFLILKQIGPNPFRFRSIAWMGGGTVVISMLYGIVIRDATFDDGRSLDLLLKDPIGVLLDRLTSGIETRPFDVLIRLNEVVAQQGFEYQLGATYAAVPAWFVPRELWENKPFGGGNTWFTSTYVPRFYGENRVETSLSAIGEAFSNFGFIGVVVVGALLGLVVSLFIRSRISRRGIHGTTIAVVITPLLFSTIRGDAYQGMSTSIGSLVILSAFVWMASSKIVRADARPEPPKSRELLSV